MNASVNLSSLFAVEWSLHIDDAGEPPSMTVVSLWLFLSLCVAVLFLILRPAATRQVRKDSENGVGAKLSVTALRKSSVFPENSGYVIIMWRALVALWTLPLYDAVHRTCCYFHLSPYMLARHRMLPLGTLFLRDGLWTEWVNWVRLYFLCDASLYSSNGKGEATENSADACVGWQLPLTGVLPYTQYPEYAALNTARQPTAAEVHLYHRIGVEALVVTIVTVVQLHSVYSLCHRVFFSISSDVKKERGATEGSTGNGAVNSSSEGTSQKQLAAGDAAESRSRIEMATNFTTSLRRSDTPGDDAWVDSPEALAEEEERRLQGDDYATEVLRNSPCTTKSPSKSQTTRLFQECWPSLLSAVYATMYAYVGGLPLLMNIVFPCSILITSVFIMSTPA